MIAEKLRKIYAGSEADALLIESDFLRRYLTGFYTTDGFVLLDGARCRFVVDARYYEAAERALRGSGTEVVLGGEKTALALAKEYRKLAVPFPYVSAERYLALKAAGHELTDCMPVLARAAAVKSAEEIARIARACDIAEEALLRLMPALKEGMAEREAAALLEYEMRARGADGVSFDTIVAFGENGSVPHHETGARKLKFGDAVLIDFGCKFEGYCSDCTRTFLFGDDGKHGEFKEAYACVLAAHERVKEELVSGMTGREADELARGVLREHGLDGLFTHSLGHGIGLLVHEAPYLSVRSEDVLTDGMVFSDEPGVYLAGKFGIRIEDSVTLKDGKTVSFMKKTERNLVIL